MCGQGGGGETASEELGSGGRACGGGAGSACACAAGGGDEGRRALRRACRGRLSLAAWECELGSGSRVRRPARRRRAGLALVWDGRNTAGSEGDWGGERGRYSLRRRVLFSGRVSHPRHPADGRGTRPTDAPRTERAEPLAAPASESSSAAESPTQGIRLRRRGPERARPPVGHRRSRPAPAACCPRGTLPPRAANPRSLRARPKLARVWARVSPQSSGRGRRGGTGPGRGEAR